MRQRIPFRRIDVGEATGLTGRDDVLTFDVRDVASFEQGHVNGARHLTQRNLSSVIGGTAKHTPIVIYCYHGNASQEYAQTFSDFGFTEVYSVDGGYEALANWQHALQATAPDEALQHWLSAQGFPADDANAVIANGTTPLMKAALQGETDIIRKLLSAGARIEAKNADGNNALWLACVDRHLDVVDLLLAAGIDLDNRNVNGATALMYASSSGKADVVAHLLAKGADTSAETPDGFSALDMAASVECLALLRRPSRSVPHERDRA